MIGYGLNHVGGAQVSPPQVPAEAKWYAISTRSRHERLVERQLQARGIDSFLPMVSEIHRWSDRRKVVDTPLFAGYIFIRIAASPQQRVNVLQTQGVVDFVGVQGRGIPIPEEQIEGIKAVLASQIPFAKHSFLKVGQRVRICGGSLDGVEGILVAQNGTRNLVISVEPIQRALSIRIEGYQVEAA
jgi:transcription antitermination factor NusG